MIDVNFYTYKDADSIQRGWTRGKWNTKYNSSVMVKKNKNNFFLKKLVTRAISAGHLASLHT